jgi:sensor histidine kinase YesM
MIYFLKKYKAFGIGILVTLILRLVLEYIGFLKIDGSLWLENIAYFIFWSFVFSLLIYKIDYLKKRKKSVLIILVLIVFLFITIFIDPASNIPENPFTVLMLTTFWMSILYVVLPSFFAKYRYYIVVVYVLVLAYFSYVRLASGSFENYALGSKDSAMILMVIPIPIFAALWIYEQWKSLKELKAGKTKAELDLLKTQINPHFFFNTLNNLYSLTVKQSEEAPKVVLKLSEMMRYTIYEGKKELVSLADEVEYLKNYIDLHKIRYQKTVDIQFDHKIDESQRVAPLMFIVPLENAIKHGIETLSDNAYIKMSLKSDRDSIRFTIENNFDPNETGDEKGIGLENLKQRLALTYPKNHELSVVKGNNVFKLTLSIQL